MDIICFTTHYAHSPETSCLPDSAQGPRPRPQQNAPGEMKRDNAKTSRRRQGENQIVPTRTPPPPPPKRWQKNKSDTLSGFNLARVQGGVVAKGITHCHLFGRLNGRFNDDRQSNFAASRLDTGLGLQRQRERGLERDL